jgi:hypothetical protein
MMTDAEQERLERDFTYYAPKGDQALRYSSLRGACKDMAALIIVTCPDSRERSLAITKIQEAVFWANSSIARNE